MDISIVVPTRNRPDWAAQLINTLATQALSVEQDVEIVVVDDASAPSQREQLRARLPQNEIARLVCLERQGGAASARNRGVDAATGQIIAFIDDDITPDSNYVGALASEHERHAEALVINGALGPLNDDPYSRFWFDRYRRVFGTPGSEFHQVRGLASGHFSLKRPLLEIVAPLFDESLPAREDFDLYLRLKAADVACFSSGRIVALNRCPSSLWKLAKQRAWYARGEYHLRRKHGEQRIAEEEARVTQPKQGDGAQGERSPLLAMTVSVAIHAGYTLEALRHEQDWRRVVRAALERARRSVARRISARTERRPR